MSQLVLVLLHIGWEPIDIKLKVKIVTIIIFN